MILGDGLESCLLFLPPVAFVLSFRAQASSARAMCRKPPALHSLTAFEKAVSLLSLIHSLSSSLSLQCLLTANSQGDLRRWP